jgi:hypothetical protein
MTHRRLFRVILATVSVVCLVMWGVSARHGAGALLVTPLCTVHATVYDGGMVLSLAIPSSRLLPEYNLLTEVIPIRHPNAIPFGDWTLGAFDDGIDVYQVFSDGEQPSFYTSGTHLVLGMPVWAAWLFVTCAAFTMCRWMERGGEAKVGSFVISRLDRGREC